MQDRAASSGPSLNAKFSKLDWPPTDSVRSAHRARGELLRQLLERSLRGAGQLVSLPMAILKRADRSERDVAARYEGHKWCDSSERRLNNELATIHHGQTRALPFLRDDGTDDHFSRE